MALYAKRDTGGQGEHYFRHLKAMTTEELHLKSAIAAELAHRDIALDAAVELLGRAKVEIYLNSSGNPELVREIEKFLEGAPHAG